MSTTICPTCGQVQGVEAYDDALWDAYHRLDDGRADVPALTFDSEWLQEHVQDEEDEQVLVFTMEKSMHERGLCVTCGRPDLTGIDPSRFLSPEDAQARYEMWAEREAERRAGC